MKINVSHKLSKAEALIRVKKLIQSLKGKFASDIKNVEETWNDSTGEIRLKIKSFDIKASINVSENLVTIDGDIPFLLRIFKSKIEEIIKSNLNNVLS